MKSAIVSVALACITAYASARDVPNNVQSFYQRITNGKCTGGTVLKDGFYSEYPGPKTFAYCQDDATGVIYLHGNGSAFANMDIDCDGLQKGPVDGRCGKSKDTQSITAFQYLVAEYSKANGNYVKDLNANFIPYVVFGNYGKKAGYTNFHPTDYGIQPLSVMAVVCGDQLVYGVWGDENGDDGKPLVGEASISLATKCFGKKITGNNGHDQTDVLYIAFPGSVNQTVNKAADWAAQDYDAFEKTISALGDQLVSQLS